MDKTFRNGTPKKTGWYLCRYDGQELPLKCYFCARKGMWQWISKDGYILTEGVTWSEPCPPLD